jgi:hypothetical protein
VTGLRLDDLFAYSVRHTGKRELSRELDDVLLQLRKKLGRLVVLVVVGSDKVLEELGSGLLLGSQGDLNSSVEEVGNLLHLGFLHGSGSQGGETDSDTTGNLGRSVTGDGVLVDGDVCLVTDLLDLGTGQTQGSEIPKDQVVVRTVGLELVLVAEQNLGDGSGVGDNLLGVSLEGGVGSLLQRNRDTGDSLDEQREVVSHCYIIATLSTHVVVGSTLTSREDGLVDSLLHVRLLVLSEEDQTSTRTSQGLVGGGADDVTVLEGRVLFSSGNETGDVSHVAQQVRSVAVGDLSQSLVVPVSGVGGSSTDDHSGLVETGVGGQLLVVDETGSRCDSVRERLEVDGRSGDLLLGGVVTVSQVTTVGKTQTHDSVLRVDQGGESRKIGSRTRVGLDVDTPDLGVEVECLKSSVSAQVLEDVDVLVTTVVSSSGQTLGVLVGQHGAVGLHNGQRGQVLEKQDELLITGVGPASSVPLKQSTPNRRTDAKSHLQ